ncbi:MAG: glucosyltransferase domain-containing protein [Clostridiales bacterium]|nr:glucosyltransferase domain-containing protein [Clostridiales bacterium]
MSTKMRSVFKLDKRRKTVLQSVLIFSLIAHLYRYANAAFNSDSLGIFRGGVDIPKQIARGRWLQPLYLYFRGSVCPPFLIGFLATVYLAVSIIIIVEILEIRKKKSIIVLCGLLCVAPSITITNAAFLPWTDVFMLSLLFSMIGAYCLTVARGIPKKLAGVVFLVLSLALYQSYIDACILICVLWLLKRCLSGDRIKAMIGSAAMMILAFALSLIVYYVSFKAACAVVSIPPSFGYNSVSSATVLSGGFRPLDLIANAYASVFQYIFRPETFYSIPAGCINAALILICAVLLFLYLRKKKTAMTVISVLLLAICPLAAYFIFILYGRNDTLLTFPVWMLYIVIAVLFELIPPDKYKWIRHVLYKTSLIFAGILIFWGVIYSNQVYLKKDVEEKQTLSLMTRVLVHMEQADGYVPGETRVALVGSLSESKASTVKLGYEFLEGRTLEYEISIMYYNNYRMYLNNILGYPINLAEPKESQTIAGRKEVIEMPAFPSPGCARMIGDTLVVKLSDTDT